MADLADVLTDAFIERVWDRVHAELFKRVIGDPAFVAFKDGSPAYIKGVLADALKAERQGPVHRLEFDVPAPDREAAARRFSEAARDGTFWRYVLDSGKDA